MVVGYSLGNRTETEDNILVSTEDMAKVITYSRTVPVSVTRMCQNTCPYCSFQKKSNLSIPYTTIEGNKAARAHGVREALYVAGERPDQYPNIKATLDLWGFDSYVEYLYTVCELGFLEGLIPVIDVGFLSPIEIKRMREICAVNKIMIDSIDMKKPKKLHPNSPGKRRDIRLKSVEWSSKLGFPIATGILVGIGELKGQKKETLKEIAHLHKAYGMIHEVTIQNFVPQKGTPMESKNPASRTLMLEAVEMARDILPDDVTINIPIDLNPDFEDFITAGVTDFGRFIEKPVSIKPNGDVFTFDDLEARVQNMGYTLQQRFPLKKSFIRDGFYSNKLGQVFDTYRYKLKKESQEKAKSTKGK